MLDTKEEQYEALVQTREFLSDPDNWIKGPARSANRKRFCVMAYIHYTFLNGHDDRAVSRKEAGWPSNQAFCRYLNKSVREPFQNAAQFNDSRYVSHEEMLAWLDDRIAELAPDEALNALEAAYA